LATEWTRGHHTSSARLNKVNRSLFLI
jgi:hypothetical protein